MKALEDLKDKTESQVKEHLAIEYVDDALHEFGKPHEETIKLLKDYSVLIAYESVGNWGCDSYSFFLLRNKHTKVLYEINGSHCSCFGFEGQFNLEPTTAEALKERNKNGVFYCGGYDSNEEDNKKAVSDYINKL